MGKIYIAHARPLQPVVGDACHLYIGDRRYVVRRFTRDNVGVNTGPEAGTTYECYRMEFRRYAWQEVRVTEDFKRALLKAAIPAFNAHDDAVANELKLCGE